MSASNKTMSRYQEHLWYLLLKNEKGISYSDIHKEMFKDTLGYTNLKVVMQHIYKLEKHLKTLGIKIIKSGRGREAIYRLSKYEFLHKDTLLKYLEVSAKRDDLLKEIKNEYKTARL